jgi:HPt (histidine-containing phosphotransfer) domain-containing protein
MPCVLDAETKIDWTKFAAARGSLGADFIRILGYFREDGEKSIAALEAAMRSKSAAAMILPAHTLKGEARQFGADGVGNLAEFIEGHARDCVEDHEDPDQALEAVVALRPIFQTTMDAFGRETNPLVERRSGGFGRKVEAANQGFGRV